MTNKTITCTQTQEVLPSLELQSNLLFRGDVKAVKIQLMHFYLFPTDNISEI